ncbi:2,3-dimethylmalate dehydratase large subunit [Pigmentiphaga humi]|uniref:2,3-dimethylmalate dehydratase large subunit n=1 Tax=Pigmentiphaga humi TaxID=2478468 RepID=A0A3P4AY86_9BURK|nr:aconitase family protein [Pigmentiphaga humi]VCU68336.1 2,3-dimethylmalate dehydratase large subunit [Pigmentiphaga humi]
MNDAIRFDGRILYLSDDPACIESQLAGRDLMLQEAGPLRDNVSTDEITPVTVMLSYDERLGSHPYVGLQAGGRRPIGRDAVRNGGFVATVAGKRYGKGSSREHSPLAELSAGIRLIVAESFERIYQQNCDNLGILTTTDFDVLRRIEAGEAIPMDCFLQGRDALTQAIIRSGGLMAYSRRANWPQQGAGDASERAGGLTLVEKIIRRHLHPDTPAATPGSGVFVRADWRFAHDYFTGMSAHLMHRAYGKPAALRDPERIVAFHDHLVLAPQSVPHVRGGLLPEVVSLVGGHHDFARDYPVRVHGELADGSGAEGICHALMTERYALPGEVVAGTDSHTPHAGALGCLAFGVGSTDMANSWVTGYVRCKVPETLRVEISGRLRPGVTAKDIVLELLKSEPVRRGDAIGAVFEYGGAAVRAMSVDERATLTNMVAELGGFTGIVEPDERTVAFLKERRDTEVTLEGWMRSDPDARYRSVIRIDGAAVKPMVARPGDPGNGMEAEALDQPVRVDIAYGGSCTGGKRDDFDAYHEVLAWGLARGRRVAPHTRFYLQFGTMAVKAYCEEQGYLETFAQAGVTLVMPGCGSCANCGPGQSTEAAEVTISAINRNFPGRSGPGSVWLASPYTVAASALAGRIASFGGLAMAVQA